MILTISEPMHEMMYTTVNTYWLICTSHNFRTSVLIDAKLESEIKDMVKQVFGENNITQHLEWVKNCVQKPHLLTVFELDARGNTSRDVDMAILKALLKGQLNFQCGWEFLVRLAKTVISHIMYSFQQLLLWPTIQWINKFISSETIPNVNIIIELNL